MGGSNCAIAPPVWIDDVQVYPDWAHRKIHVRATLGNLAGDVADATLSLQAACRQGDRSRYAATIDVPIKVAHPQAIVESDYMLGPEALPWTEFSPNVYRLSLALKSATAIDRRKVGFGLREFKAKGTQFTVNGRATFLRGKHDACVFPLTGHPPMDIEAWTRYFSICKSYGINHVRFHTWCPPDAAFSAADRVGVYLQPELPNWSPFDGKSPHDRYLWREAERIVQTFGNHPSFVMLSLGNEMGGDTAAMARLVKHLHEIDLRRLYAQGSNNFFWKPNLALGDDYWTTVRTLADKGVVNSVRGSFASVDAPLGHVQIGPANTMTDYRRSIAGVPVPVIGHEVGQYTVYPDFGEIAKYTGVLRARNFEIFREKLKAKGMLDQAEQFRQASGALAVLCYREDIEAALRTPGFGGFQLLDLQDFPGQGTALVGILNAFMESKGLIEPKAWREFCSEVVPLIRMKKYAWTTAEVFSASVEVAYYGSADLRGIKPAWSLIDSQARSVASGELPAIDVPQGGVTAAGNIATALATVSAPQKLTLEVSLPDTPYKNHYSIWVYPAKIDTAPPPEITLRDRSTPKRGRRWPRAGGSC